MSDQLCPICKSPLISPSLDRIPTPFLTESYDCPRCGKYEIMNEVLSNCLIDNNTRYALARPRLSAIIRERQIHKEAAPLITASPDRLLVDHFPDAIDIDSLLKRFPEKISDRVDRALINLKLLSSYAGDEIPISLRDSSVFFSESIEDTKFRSRFYIMYQLIEDAFISSKSQGKSIPDELTITPRGWNRIAEIEVSGNPFSRQAFVAMSFDKTMDSVWDNGFETAIKNAGYKPLRIDMKEHNNMIPDEIIAEIRNSKFVVCDFTDQRSGVYFEAGFAMGLNKPIIWTCRSDEMEKCHFDTNHFNHITWENEEDLNIKLYNRIRATII